RRRQGSGQAGSSAPVGGQSARGGKGCIRRACRAVPAGASRPDRAAVVPQRLRFLLENRGAPLPQWLLPPAGREWSGHANGPASFRFREEKGARTACASPGFYSVTPALVAVAALEGGAEDVAERSTGVG